MIMFWIFLYIIGFVATTITMKFFGFCDKEPEGDWWMAVFLWPLFVPIALCILFFKKVVCTGGSWWDRISDEIVKKLKEVGSRSSAE